MTKILMTKQFKTVAVCFILGVLAFTVGLYSQEFIKINCRYALFAYEMDLSDIGPFPILYGHPYADYPSLHVILISLITKLLGVNMLSVTLPSAIAGSGILVMTYLIGEKQSHRFGICAVCLLLLTYQFLILCRVPSPDIFVTFFGLVSFYLVYSADLNRRYYLLFYLPLLGLLGFAIRGPIGTVIPAAIVFAYYLIGRDFKKLLISGMIFAVTFFLGVGVFAFWAYLNGGDKLVEEFLTNQLLGRFPGNKPFWFYFLNGICVYSLSFPLAVIVIGSYLFRLRKGFFKIETNGSPAHLRQALTAWISIIVLGLSIPGDKHMRYIVSISPAIALMAAFIFENPDQIPLFNKIKTLLISLARWVPFILAGGLVVAKIILIIFKVQLPFLVIIPCSFFLILGIMSHIYYNRISRDQRSTFILMILATAIIGLQVIEIEPIDQYLESSKMIVAKTEKFRPENTPVCFFGLGPDGDELKYLVNIDLSRIFFPIFVSYENPEQLLKLEYKNMPIIARENKIQFIPPEVLKHLREITKGKLGHKTCRVYIADLYKKNRKKPLDIDD